MKLILLIAVLGIFVVYSWMHHRRRPMDKLQWYNTMAATFISVLAAFLVGILLYDIQVNKNDKQRRERVCSVLTVELNREQNKFESMEPMALKIDTTGAVVKLPLTYSEPVILRDTAHSNLFDEDDPSQLSRIADNIGTYNMLVQYALAVIYSSNTSSPDFEKRAKHLSSQLEKSRKTIVLQCKDFLERMEDSK